MDKTQSGDKSDEQNGPYIPPVIYDAKRGGFYRTADGHRMTDEELAEYRRENPPQGTAKIVHPAWIEEELKDGDRICEAAGVHRTEGGRLPVAKIVNKLLARSHEATNTASQENKARVAPSGDGSSGVPATSRALPNEPAALSSTGTREKALADVLQRIFDDWANANTIGLDLQEEAGRALDMPLVAPSATALSLSERERVTISNLIELAHALDHALDDSEETPSGDLLTEAHSNMLTLALVCLNELPDDKPGYTLGPAGKARWALRRLIGDDESGVPTDGGTDNKEKP